MKTVLSISVSLLCAFALSAQGEEYKSEAKRKLEEELAIRAAISAGAPVVTESPKTEARPARKYLGSYPSNSNEPAYKFVGRTTTVSPAVNTNQNQPESIQSIFNNADWGTPSYRHVENSPKSYYSAGAGGNGSLASLQSALNYYRSLGNQANQPVAMLPSLPSLQTYQPLQLPSLSDNAFRQTQSLSRRTSSQLYGNIGGQNVNVTSEGYQVPGYDGRSFNYVGSSGGTIGNSSISSTYRAHSQSAYEGGPTVLSGSAGGRIGSSNFSETYSGQSQALYPGGPVHSSGSSSGYIGATPYSSVTFGNQTSYQIGGKNVSCYQVGDQVRCIK